MERIIALRFSASALCPLRSPATVGLGAFNRKFSQNEHWRQRTAEESSPCGTTMLIPQLGHLRLLIGKGSQARDSELNPTVLPRMAARWKHGAPGPARRPDRVRTLQLRLDPRRAAEEASSRNA